MKILYIKRYDYKLIVNNYCTNLYFVLHKGVFILGLHKITITT